MIINHNMSALNANRVLGNDVQDLFNYLLDEIKKAIDELRRQGTLALQSEDLVTAGQLVEKAKQFDDFRQKIIDLQEEWNSLASDVGIHNKKRVVRRRSKNRKAKHRKRGELTPKENYYQPILQALMDMNGKGSRPAVLQRLERSMASVFNQFDREPDKSDHKPTWHKRASFARLDMVKLGLLTHSSGRGVWEITEKGKKWFVDRK